MDLCKVSLRTAVLQFASCALVGLLNGFPIAAYSQWYVPAKNASAEAAERGSSPWHSVNWEKAAREEAVIRQLELANKGPLADFLWLSLPAAIDGTDAGGALDNAVGEPHQKEDWRGENLDDSTALLEQIFQPKLIEPGNPILVDPDDLVGEHEPVYYVNGMWRTRLDAQEDAANLAKRIKRPIWLIHNPTVGEPGNSEPVDYLRLLRYAAFLNLPAPSESLIEYSLGDAGSVDVHGLGKVGLNDYCEALWDREWGRLQGLSPEFALFNETHRLCPPQHNIATRQLAHLLCHAERKVSIISHEQGCLIVRNALAIAEHFGRGEWLKRNVAWVPLMPPFEEQELAPQVVDWEQKVQFVFVRERAPAPFWQGVPTNWVAMDIPWQPLVSVLAIHVPEPRWLWPTPYRNARYLQVANRTGDRVRVWVQFRHYNSALSRWTWVPAVPPPKDTAQKRQAVTFDLEPGESQELTYQQAPVRAARVRIWAESETGWRRTEFLDRDLWLVNPETGRYIADKYETYIYTVSEPRSAQKYRNRRVLVSNSTTEPVHGGGRVYSEFADGHWSWRSAQMTTIQPGDSALLHDSDGWPLYGERAKLSFENRRGDKQWLDDEMLLTLPYRLVGGMGEYHHDIMP